MCSSPALEGVGAGGGIVLEWSAKLVNNLFRHVSILIHLQSVWVRTASHLTPRRWVDIYWDLRILRAARSHICLTLPRRSEEMM